MNTTGKTILAALMLTVAGGAAFARGAGDRTGDGAGMMGGMMEGDGMGPMAAFDFAAADADKDGKITQAEMAALRAAEVAGIDADKDGKISTAELKAMHMARMEARATRMADEMVARMDSDGDGALTAAEMAARPAMPWLFDMIDADGDGAVTEAEIADARARMEERMGGNGDGEGKGGHGGHHRGWFFGGDN